MVSVGTDTIITLAGGTRVENAPGHSYIRANKLNAFKILVRMRLPRTLTDSGDPGTDIQSGRTIVSACQGSAVIDSGAACGCGYWQGRGEVASMRILAARARTR